LRVASADMRPELGGWICSGTMDQFGPAAHTPAFIRMWFLMIWGGSTFFSERSMIVKSNSLYWKVSWLKNVKRGKIILPWCGIV